MRARLPPTSLVAPQPREVLPRWLGSRAPAFQPRGILPQHKTTTCTIDVRAGRRNEESAALATMQRCRSHHYITCDALPVRPPPPSAFQGGQNIGASPKFAQQVKTPPKKSPPIGKWAPHNTLASPRKGDFQSRGMLYIVFGHLAPAFTSLFWLPCGQTCSIMHFAHFGIFAKGRPTQHV